MSYPHLSAKLFGRPLLLHPPVLTSFGQALAARMAGPRSGISGPSPISHLPSAAASASLSDRAACIYEEFADIAVIRISGVIDKAVSQFDMDCYGGCDLRDIDEALACAKADPGIARIVLHLDTPGGSVVGTPETAARIADLALEKEVHAYCDTQCCSAGMWLAAGADVIACTPSAIVGSIGVYLCCIDESAALENEGIKVNVINAGQFKTMGASFRAMTPDERQMLQTNVDRIHTDFKAAITATREVPASAMEGQWYPASEAIEYGVVDELTPLSLDEYVSALLTN
jgi:protease-4